MSDELYKPAKDSQVIILWRGRRVTTLRGVRAVRFVTDASGAGAAEQQLLMARAMGNFKRGNER